MAPSPSTETGAEGDGPAPATGARAHGPALLAVARASLREGAQSGHPLRVDPSQQPAPLREPGACFVTLRQQGVLRGCIGSLEPVRPLVCDVAENAFAAGFRDPRFAPLGLAELAGLAVEISVLGGREPLPAHSREALLRALAPGADGLVLSRGGRRATFLPAVWESLPEPQAFVGALLRKAGLPEDEWPKGLVAERYATWTVADGGSD